MKSSALALITYFAISCGGGNSVTLTPDARGGGADANMTTDAPISTADAGGTVDSFFNFPDADPSDADPTLPDGAFGINCGGLTCDMNTQECCSDFVMGVLTLTCETQGACPGAVVTCDGPEDCSGGDVCCAQQQGIECAPTCGGLVLCANQNDCPSGSMCCPLQGINICSSFGCF